jgi:hypothetical protein
LTASPSGLVSDFGQRLPIVGRAHGTAGYSSRIVRGPGAQRLERPKHRRAATNVKLFDSRAAQLRHPLTHTVAQ